MVVVNKEQNKKAQKEYGFSLSGSLNYPIHQVVLGGDFWPMRRIKKVLLLFLIIGTLFIALDFIPIKFAKAKGYIGLQNREYYCNTEPKIDGKHKWIAKKELNPNLNKDMFLTIYGNNPNNILSEKNFDIIKWYELDNGFIFTGELVINDEDIYHQYYISTIYIESWDIVYPIRRASFRRYYAPKGYLTFYDFDWGKIIKNKIDIKSISE